ncbi:MAG: PA2169 family four-helix-bundle protein [Caldilineaceae bacterium]
MEPADVVVLLNDLIATNRDSVEGYRTAAGAVENADYRQIFLDAAQQRAAFVDVLSHLVQQYGGDPTSSGNLSGTFQRAWLNIKAALTEGDGAIMDECDQSDEAALALYADTLPKDLPEDVKTVVRHQLSEIRIAHDRVHMLNAALAQS